MQVTEGVTTTYALDVAAGLTQVLVEQVLVESRYAAMSPVGVSKSALGK